jgi:hypothetical protein
MVRVGRLRTDSAKACRREALRVEAFAGHIARFRRKGDRRCAGGSDVPTGAAARRGRF